MVEKTKNNIRRTSGDCASIDFLMEENELLLNGYSQLQYKIKELYEENEKLRGESSGLREQIKEKNRKLKVLSQKKKSISVEIERVEQGASGLALENRRLQSEMEKLRDSIPWKIISPATALAKPFMRTRKGVSQLKQDIKVIKDSGLFDSDWYLENNPDVAISEMDPVEHFVTHGASEMRDPSAEFSIEWYGKVYPDVIKSGINPLIHYIKFGRVTNQ